MIYAAEIVTLMCWEKFVTHYFVNKIPVKPIHVYLRLMVMCINLGAPKHCCSVHPQPPGPYNQQTIPKCEYWWVPPPVSPLASRNPPGRVHRALQSVNSTEVSVNFGQWPWKVIASADTHKQPLGISAAATTKLLVIDLLSVKKTQTLMGSLTCRNFFLWVPPASSKLDLMLLKNLSTARIGIVLCAFLC